MKFLTDEKLVIVGAAGMIGSNMAQSALMMGLTSNLCLYDVFSPEDVAEAFKDAKDIISSGGSREDIKDELLKKIADIAKGIIDDGMTSEQKCRAIYAYIQDKIEYAPLSYKSDRYLAAYNALFVTGEGDCYSYFAAAKAFFDYLGIENRDMQRAAGYTDDTHYWNLVNIGEGGDDSWYHFDATVMRQEYKINSCLLTDAQIEAYSEMRPYFYKHDKRNLPSSSDEIITENPILDSYIEK